MNNYDSVFMLVGQRKSNEHWCRKFILVCIVGSLITEDDAQQIWYTLFGEDWE